MEEQFHELAIAAVWLLIEQDHHTQGAAGGSSLGDLDPLGTPAALGDQQ